MQRKKIDKPVSNKIKRPDSLSDSSEKKSENDACDNENIRYFFGADGYNLGCNINIKTPSKLDLNFINTILDTLEVLNVQSYCDPIITVDEKNGLFKITLRNVNCSHEYQAIIDFITRLDEMGIKELHENKNALWFYSNSGDQILQIHNYPAQLRKFLADEFTSADDILKQHKGSYTTLVEVGCGNMVNLKLATVNKLRYVGLDFSATAIRSVQDEIKRNPYKYPNARVYCFNILDAARIQSLFTPNEKPIFLLPFNLFGNIAPISLLIAKLREQNFDLLISIYKTDDKTNLMRQAYYSNCGYKAITVTKDETGLVFSSNEGLYTIAYDIRYLSELFQRFGFNISTISTGDYGYLLRATPMPLQLTLRIDQNSPREEVVLTLNQTPKKTLLINSPLLLESLALSSVSCMILLAASKCFSNANAKLTSSNIAIATVVTTVITTACRISASRLGFWNNPVNTPTTVLQMENR